MVILAGSVVRTTQSGMGCPDWPRCFGYYIPPTDPAQLQFQSAHSYRKGMMIIRNDTLWRAVHTFQSGENFHHADWEKYPKHNYARFVPEHTWIEYVNRLSGALMGFFVFGMAICSFAWFRQKPLLTWLSMGMLLLTGFQGWLGALVVASHLAPVKITIHMVAAVVLLILVQFIRHRTLDLAEAGRAYRDAFLQRMVFFALFLTLVQILLGTGVREQIDEIARMNNYSSRESWVEQLSQVFWVHRSFSIALLLLNGWIVYKAIKGQNNRAMRFASLAGALLVLEVLAGTVLNYGSFPAAVQPIHLLLSMLLFSAQLETWLSLKLFSTSSEFE